MDGLELFVRYALPPNVLGYCGPNLLNKDKQSLLQFEGAVPYLRLIASANNISDEFDKRVVEAYWLGNDLLEKVSDKNLYSNIEDRFRKKMKSKDWFWLVSKSIPKAKPHHVFHVFDVYRRAGLIRSGIANNILETIDNCRIGWGKVTDTRSNMVIVEYHPIIFEKNKLKLGEKTTKKYISLDSKISAGDNVSLHWEHICAKITERQKKNLAYWTKFHLDITNQTL